MVVGVGVIVCLCAFVPWFVCVFEELCVCVCVVLEWCIRFVIL